MDFLVDAANVIAALTLVGLLGHVYNHFWPPTPEEEADLEIARDIRRWRRYSDN